MEEISSLIKPTSSYPKDCSLFLPTLLYSMELLCSNFQESSNVLDKFSFMIYYILMGFFFVVLTLHGYKGRSPNIFRERKPI